MTWNDAFHLAATLGVPLALCIGWIVVGVLKRRGYHTAYIEALLGAVGAGEAEARKKGVSFASLEGRAVGMDAAIGYLRETVGDTAAPALGIVSDEDHAARVNSRVDAMQLQADINATALASRV